MKVLSAREDDYLLLPYSWWQYPSGTIVIQVQCLMCFSAFK